MKPEEKKTLGRLIRDHRQRLNWSQERLAGAAGIHLRTVQRAEGGYGISSENLASIASALELDERELRTLAATAGPPPPEKRIPLQGIRSGKDLLEILERYHLRSGWSMELAPPEEHRFNEMVAERIVELTDELENKPRSAKEQLGAVRHAQEIVSIAQHMGFTIFAGTYTEEIRIKQRTRKKKALLVIAAPTGDPRVVRTAKGAQLDVVRDSRRLVFGSTFAGHSTPYEWMEDQLISKSNGEFRVNDVLRRMMREVMAEIQQAEHQARDTQQ
jgi:transcriptional regulator with XRE-family HTH domain